MHGFDGIFANASLFHVPSQELQRVLLELFQTLKPRGVLFSLVRQGAPYRRYGPQSGSYRADVERGSSQARS